MFRLFLIASLCFRASLFYGNFVGLLHVYHLKSALVLLFLICIFRATKCVILFEFQKTAAPLIILCVNLDTCEAGEPNEHQTKMNKIHWRRENKPKWIKRNYNDDGVVDDNNNNNNNDGGGDGISAGDKDTL